MSDTFAGLTRRINAYVHDRDTSEELSHLIDEAKETGGDASDALIELALGDNYIDVEDYETPMDLNEDFQLILEDYDDGDGDEDDDGMTDEDEDGVSEDDIDSELHSLGNDIDDADDDLLEHVQLRHGELLLI